MIACYICICIRGLMDDPGHSGYGLVCDIRAGIGFIWEEPVHNPSRNPH